MTHPIKLSICIATFNRANFIGQTLDSILSQMQKGVELVIVDGASPDHTEEVIQQYLKCHPHIRYYREEENSGIDKDYDKAVGYARGEYCWLMPDDDLIKPDAIEVLLSRLDSKNDLIVVNAEVANANFSKILDAKLIKSDADKTYDSSNKDDFLAEVGHGLSFIGCIIINRSKWLARERASYFGTLFIHVGVILQAPSLNKIELISNPLVTIRYGNAMWTPRGLEIWLVKWPNLIWSFIDFSTTSRSAVCPKSEIKKLKRVAFYRATGAYGLKEFKQFLCSQSTISFRCLFFLLALAPPMLMNIIASFYCVIFDKHARMVIYSLNTSKYKNRVSSWASRVAGV